MLQTASMIPQCPRLIRLDFQDVRAFESVTDRYCHFGVEFSCAIALEPSNPAFESKPGKCVLMPSGSETRISVSFNQPASLVGAMVCGAGTIAIAAFDCQGNLLQQASTAGNPWSSAAQAWSSQQLQLNRAGISQVVFYSSEPFILDDFFFSQAF
jgi:hypothetical protein